MSAVQRVTDAFAALDDEDAEVLANFVLFVVDMVSIFDGMSVTEAAETGATLGGAYMQRTEVLGALGRFADALTLPSH